MHFCILTWCCAKNQFHLSGEGAVGRFSDRRQQTGAALPEYPVQCCGFRGFTGFVAASARSRALPFPPVRGSAGQRAVGRDAPVIPGERLREGQLHTAVPVLVPRPLSPWPGLGSHAKGRRPVTDERSARWQMVAVPAFTASP